MRNVFETLCREVILHGARFDIDFKKRSMKLNGEYLIKDGEPTIDRGCRLYVPENFLWHVEDFYRLYRKSTPSERSESRSKRYFKAKHISEMTDEDMMYGQNREFALAQLEGYILCCMVEGVKWDESWGKWFWQCPDEPDLVLLREWFEPKVEGV